MFSNLVRRPKSTTQSFKKLAKQLAREDQIQSSAKLNRVYNSKFAHVQVENHNDFQYQVLVKDPITFKQVLDKSKFLKLPETDTDLKKLEDKSGIRPFFNLASIINENHTLQKLVDLGTNLSQWEKQGLIDVALIIDFHKDVVPRIHFLLDLGIHPDNLGQIFTLNPFLFQQQLEDLKVRINYLSWRKFTKDQIKTIVNKTNSSWLNYAVPTLDAKLGFLQKIFHLKGQEVRQVTESCPHLILWEGTPTQLENNYMALKHSMGFSATELSKLAKNAPNMLMAEDTDLIQDKFDLLHNDAGYSHELLANFAQALNGDLLTIKTRLLFLQKLGKDQFDPSLPNYVNPYLLVNSPDKKFCEKAAKAPVDLLNKFALTL